MIPHSYIARVLILVSGLVLSYNTLKCQDGFTASFGKINEFIENSGQYHAADYGLNDSILYAAIGAHEKYFFTSKGVLTIWDERTEKKNPIAFLKKTFSSEEKKEEMEREGEFYKYRQYSLSAIWNHASTQTQIIADGRAEHYHTFAGCKFKSAAFRSITYKNIYDHIDVQYLIPSDSTGIKYNIILYPGAHLEDVELLYGGDFKKMVRTDNGDITIESKREAFAITEHAPVSFYQHGGKVIFSNALITGGNTIKYVLYGVTEITEQIVIDPWVTTLVFSGFNMGYDVDYDDQGNVYGFIAGSNSGNNFIAKYNGNTGAFMWYFHYDAWLCGNFKVNKTTHEVYYIFTEPSGISRLSPSGIDEGFITNQNGLLQESWDISVNCTDNEQMLILGGAASYDIQMGIVDPVTTNITTTNISGLPGDHQDIVSGAINNQGELFVLIAAPGAAGNKIVKVNSTYDGPEYVVASGASSFSEGSNHIEYSGYSGNQFNVLDINDSYLYYYNGRRLAAFTPALGSFLGQFNISGYSARQQGGIAVDDCNNVYVGGHDGEIHYFHFDGNNFNQLGTIDLNWPSGAQPFEVFDVKYDRFTHKLFAIGRKYVCKIDAPITPICNPLTVTSNCISAGDGTATATLGLEIGDGTVSYTWTNAAGIIVSQTVDSPSTNNTVIGLATGTYTVVAHINAPCGYRYSKQVSIVCPICDVDATAVNVSCFGAATGSATAIPQGGTGPFNYTWNTSPVQHTSTINNISAGNYSVSVTDVTGCVATTQVIVQQPPQLVVAASITAFVNCFGQNTSEVTAQVSGGIAAYSYTWNTSPVQHTTIATNLAAGNYSVSVFDANGCNANASVAISEPLPLSVTITEHIDNLCFGDNDGSATAFVSGGTLPYSYSWNSSPQQNAAAATSLTAGNFTITIFDFNGCSASADITISEPTLLEATITSTNEILCFSENTGSAAIAVEGGISPYTYSWNTTPEQNDDTAEGLEAGQYTAFIQDANGCTTSSTINIAQPTDLVVAINSFTDVLCFGENTGTASVTASGGNDGYSYSWNTTPVQNTETASELTGGVYEITVTDLSGCAQSAEITIYEPPLLTANITSSLNVLCYGNYSGSASAIAEGGTAPYDYVWNTLPVQNTSTATNLPSGEFEVIVSDANGCTANSTINISQPAQLIVEVNPIIEIFCYGDNTGEALATVIGGVGPYSYTWNTQPVQTVSSSNQLAAGNYSVSIVDSNGCEASDEITINQPSLLTVNIDNLQDVLCYGGNTGFASGVANGGSPSYSYSWNTIPEQVTATAINLTTGNYTVQVTDENGCVAETEINIDQPELLEVSINDSTNVVCYGESTGSASALTSGGSLPYTYEWSVNSGQSTSMMNNLSCGDYLVTVIDANGCTSEDDVHITQPSQIIVSIISSSDAICFDEDSGSAVADASGGTGPYSYAWNTIPIQQSPTATSLHSGNYVVTVSDSIGCSAQTNVTITEPSPLTGTISQLNDEICFGDQNGSATISGLGGISPYNYSWNTNPQQTSATAINLSAGNFIATITDDNGCLINISVEIHQPSPLTVQLSGEDEGCFALCDGQATASTSGGTQPYFYSWSVGNISVGGNNPLLGNLCSGDYDLVVTDSHNCQQNATLNISGPEEVMITELQSTPQFCLNDCTGSITIHHNNALQFSIDGGQTYQTSGVFEELCAGIYNIVVSGINDCNVSDVIIVEQLLTPIAEFTHTPDPATISNPLVLFTDHSQFAGNCFWDFGGLETSEDSNPTFRFPDDPGTYEVCLTAINQIGCADSACKSVIIEDEFSIYVPNAFTPTNDDLNDLFKPVLNGMKPLSYSFIIFNRWGEKIFETTDPEKGWNGGFGTTYCQPDIYNWVIEVVMDRKDTQPVFKGSVTLIR